MRLRSTGVFGIFSKSFNNLSKMPILVMFLLTYLIVKIEPFYRNLFKTVLFFGINFQDMIFNIIVNFPEFAE